MKITKKISLVLLLLLNILSFYSSAATTLQSKKGFFQGTIEQPKVTLTVLAPTAITLDGIIDKDDDESPKRKLIYTLGGMRIKFEFSANSIADPIQRADIKEYSWKMGAAGRHCTTYEELDAECIENNGTDSIVGADKSILYWEPAATIAGTVATDWDNSLKATPELTVSFNDTKYQDTVIAFKLENRELKGVAAPDTMKGSDVEILESMLWHMGISSSKEPSYLFGKRVSVIKNRKILNSGINTVGRMLGRFNYLAEATLLKIYSAPHFLVQEGKVKTLSELKRHWEHYTNAIQARPNNSTFNINDLSETELQAASNVFDGIISYPLGKSFPNITGTYTPARHDNVKQYKTFKRIDLLKAMAEKESGGMQWVADYRMVLGGVAGLDEAGSKGFNQIQNTYTYGKNALDGTLAKDCPEVSAYDATGASVINHYDPAQNLVAKAVWLAKPYSKCGGAFHNVFVKTDKYQKTYNSEDNFPLVSYKTGSVIETVTGGSHKDDDYELLSKGVGGYNQGGGVYRFSTSWLGLIINQPYKPTFKGTISDKQKKILAVSTAMKYSIDILHTRLALPYRVYKWKGGTYATNKDEDNDGIFDSDAGQDWCFEFNEEDWRNGMEWAEVKKSAIGNTKKAPVGRVSCL